MAYLAQYVLNDLHQLVLIDRVEGCLDVELCEVKRWPRETRASTICVKAMLWNSHFAMRVHQRPLKGFDVAVDIVETKQRTCENVASIFLNPESQRDSCIEMTIELTFSAVKAKNGSSSCWLIDLPKVTSPFQSTCNVRQIVHSMSFPAGLHACCACQDSQLAATHSVWAKASE